MSKRSKAPPPAPPPHVPWAILVEFTTTTPSIIGAFPSREEAERWMAAWTNRPPEVLRAKPVPVDALLDALAPLWERG